MSTGWIDEATIDPTYYGRTSSGKSKRMAGKRFTGGLLEAIILTRENTEECRQVQSEKIKILMEQKRSRDHKPSDAAQDKNDQPKPTDTLQDSDAMSSKGSGQSHKLDQNEIAVAGTLSRSVSAASLIQAEFEGTGSGFEAQTLGPSAGAPE